MRRVLFIAVLIASALAAACGGSSSIDNTELLAAQSGGLEMTEVEETARSLVEQMAVVLTENASDPDAAVAAIEAWLADNRAQLVANAEAMEARYQSFEGVDQRAYEYSLSAFMHDATFAWADARDAFTEEHPDHGEAIDTMLADFGDE